LENLNKIQPVVTHGTSIIPRYTRRPYLEQKEELCSILLIKENILAAITPQDVMIASARIMKSRFPYHIYHPGKKCPFVKPDPITIIYIF